PGEFHSPRANTPLRWAGRLFGAHRRRHLAFPAHGLRSSTKAWVLRGLISRTYFRWQSEHGKRRFFRFSSRLAAASVPGLRAADAIVRPGPPRGDPVRDMRGAAAGRRGLGGRLAVRPGPARPVRPVRPVPGREFGATAALPAGPGPEPVARPPAQ